MTQREKFRARVFEKYNGKCGYTGHDLLSDWQIDHIIPKSRKAKGSIVIELNHINNLMPCIKIINHYKRDKNLEEWQEFLMRFHLRFKRLPKNTVVEKTKKRIIYMNKIAQLFNISINKPFDGVFYFEKLPTNIDLNIPKENIKPHENTSLQNIDGEIWKPILKYNSYYHVSNYGRIKSMLRVDSKGQTRKECIKKLSLTICKKYKVNYNTVYSIRTGRNWSWLTGKKYIKNNCKPNKEAVV